MSTTLKATTELPVTLAELKLRLRIETDDEDEVLESLLLSASIAVSNYTNRAIAKATYELKLDAFPAHEIRLLWPMAVAISSVEYVDAAWQTAAVPCGDWSLDGREDESWLLPAPGKAWPDTAPAANAVKIAYTAGWGLSAPEPVRNYIMLHVGHFYKNRELTTSKQQQTLLFARGLIQPYRLVEI